MRKKGPLNNSEVSAVAAGEEGRLLAAPHRREAGRHGAADALAPSAVDQRQPHNVQPTDSPRSCRHVAPS